MPYTMTHLIIAKNVYRVFDKHIKSLPQYYLGSVAPDAVHNRANYISDYKKESHLFVGAEKWGFMTNHNECKSNVIAFFIKNKQSENHDFILGYCVHILSDIYHHLTVTTPLMKKYRTELDVSFGNLYRQESNRLDIELALTHEGKDDFWLNLAKSQGVTLQNIIYSDEIDKQKHFILNYSYKDKVHQDLSLNKIVTYKANADYLRDATDSVIMSLSTSI